MLKLPQLITPQNRLPWGFFLLGWIIVLYVVPNNFLLNVPIVVPLTDIDSLIPLQAEGWTWVYISYYFYLAAVYLFVRNLQNLNQFFYSMSVSAVIAALIFFLYPTSIDRSLYPLLQVQSSSEWILWFIRKIDHSRNCAPSMHVTMTVIAALTAYAESRKIGVAAILWAVLIAYSTMATKQHYFIDVAGGLLFGLGMFASFRQAQFYRLTSSTTASS